MDIPAAHLEAPAVPEGRFSFLDLITLAQDGAFKGLAQSHEDPVRITPCERTHGTHFGLVPSVLQCEPYRFNGRSQVFLLEGVDADLCALTLNVSFSSF